MNTTSLVFQNFIDFVVCTHNHGRALTEDKVFHPRRSFCKDAFFSCFFSSQAFFFSNPSRHKPWSTLALAKVCRAPPPVRIPRTEIHPQRVRLLKGLFS